MFKETDKPLDATSWTTLGDNAEPDVRTEDISVEILVLEQLEHCLTQGMSDFHRRAGFDFENHRCRAHSCKQVYVQVCEQFDLVRGERFYDALFQQEMASVISFELYHMVSEGIHVPFPFIGWQLTSSRRA